MTNNLPTWLLTRNRKVTSDWVLSQTEALLAFAVQNNSANALVYAALEARNSIERFVFEMSVLASGGKLSDVQVESSVKKDGTFDLLEDCAPEYRKLMEFMNLTMEVMGQRIRFRIPNIKSFIRIRTALSEFCHCQMDPDKTVDHPQHFWFIRGVGVVEKAIGLLKPLLNNHQGMIDRQSMPVPVRDLYEEYQQDKVTELQVKTRLEIMQPVLEWGMQLEKHSERALLVKPCLNDPRDLNFGAIQ